ncbi:MULTISPECIES: DUF6179 domain-containing protein [Bacillota]|uniref:Uncharacterized protein n=2 Tax=Amedibacillus TaxID=2749846 RepID=A0A7G9GKS8_9FIRM|nr:MULTISPECIES: DUF6179 domain-containing protein [Bacillota]QNM11410.1 hypothetical protein H9Q80_14285 [[Eubacterium] hominis]MCH4284576.1 DUF6179 domain-containing protein [Amedibacillus hominis]RGB54744.1 hypothetical protein DW271_10270 [Absiella sp. AM22-9]RGB60378.1 hypothetical protein DW120_09330 [Absiella sp. AM10-20]RGB65241.1 hypothetical protein DW113_12855 [Absiella sp. AM09-45]
MNNLSTSVYENKEVYALSKRLSLEKNRHRSTAISIKDYQRILKSISFICDHATRQGTLEIRYASGLKEVERLVKETRQQADIYLKKQRPLPNERYRSILTQQLPDFLSSYDEHYHATSCKEDFDYPLLYGLPLEHAMYHKQGIDLVAYYLSMFCMEERILHLFHEQLSDFLTSYAVFYGVEIEELGINFCELIITQAFFSFSLKSFSLKHRYELLISHEQKQQIIQIIKQAEDLFKLYQAFLSIFDTDIKQYLSGYGQILINKITWALKEDTLDQLIVHEMCRNEIEVNIHAFNEPEHFFTLLKHLEGCDTQKRIEAVLHSEIGFYDYIDLFDMQILSKDEYFLLFQMFDSMSLAYLFYIHFEEACVFHQRIELDDTLYQKVSIMQDWEEVFIQYLITCDRKMEIKNCLISLQDGAVRK